MASMLLGGGLIYASAPNTDRAIPVAALAKNPKPKAYKNCSQLNKVKGDGKPVTTFTLDTKTYKLNKKRDGDKDGIACEKK